MREFSVPALAEVDPSLNCTDLVLRQVEERPASTGYRVKDGSGWRDVSWGQFRDEVAALAKGLIAQGVHPGDRVGLMSRTRYEWTLMDFAIWFAGAVTVPVYETSSADQIAWALGDSGAVAVLVESTGHKGLVERVHSQLPGLRHVWCIDDGDIADLSVRGKDISDSVLEDARSRANLDDLATIIYTSGTTGRPKGCELTHGNFVVLAENASAIMDDVLRREGGVANAATLLFLPLAHVFARFIQMLCVSSGVTMGHSADIKTILDDFASYKPDFILAVPRVFEKVYNSAEQKALAGGKGKVFAQAAATAIAYSEALDGRSVPLSLRARHKIFDVLVYKKLRAAMGGRTRYAVSGGAPLGERLGHFFRGMGLTILEGYGLTETTAPTAVNKTDLVRIGTVGPPLPGTSAKIAEDGEILLKGPHIFRGYWHNPAATEEAFKDGWFHTGDLGEITDDGCLKITGRKKEIIITAGGKNVVPAVLEDALRAHPLIGQAIVIGDNLPFVSALITLDPEMLPAWLSNQGKPAMTLQDAALDEDVHAAVQKAIDEANTRVSRAESIRAFRLLKVEFTEEAGHMTPSLKLKRGVILKDFADDVSALYGS